MGVQLKRKIEPGRNDPCPCESGLKFKICHGDPLKIAVCNRVANEKMCELIKQEQRKKIINQQQKECTKCNSKGFVQDDNVQRTCSCQFIDEKEKITEQYKNLTEGENKDDKN